MPALQRLANQFRQQGLTVREYGNALHVLSQPSDSEGFQVFEKVCAITLSREGFQYSKWDYTPGPGPDDIEIVFQSCDDAFRAGFSYHFGTPTIIEFWYFNDHLHPEWQIEALRELVKKRELLDVEAKQELFADLEKERKRISPGHYPGDWTNWHKRPDLYYFQMAKTDPSASELFLKADLTHCFQAI